MASNNLVENWYDENADLEVSRLDEARLEFAVTMRVITQLLGSKRQAAILDVGGGGGRYGA
jgi:2-polyprenyl-3-methyl-5-hydroxy-6-metoxy-1,4-benzoquinol methylase